jgi:hypothetical protein
VGDLVVFAFFGHDSGPGDDRIAVRIQRVAHSLYLFAFCGDVGWLSPGPSHRPVGGAHEFRTFVFPSPRDQGIAARVEGYVWVARPLSRRRDEGRRFPIAAFGPVGAFDDVARAVEVHPDGRHVAAGIHRGLGDEAFAAGDRGRRFPAAQEGPERALDHFALLPDRGCVAFPIDRDPGFGVGAEIHLADVDRRRPAATGRPIHRLHDDLGPAVAFPEHGHVAVAIHRDLR